MTRRAFTVALAAGAALMCAAPAVAGAPPTKTVKLGQRPDSTQSAQPQEQPQEQPDPGFGGGW